MSISISKWLQTLLETTASSGGIVANARTVFASLIRFTVNAITMCQDIHESFDPGSCGVVVVLVLATLVLVVGPTQLHSFKVD